MLIKRIKAQNFKTYLNLDLDISVEQDKPIILIGGENGGGKTTLFEAIYGALYGLHIINAERFKQLLNAGALGNEVGKIILELHFSGKVLNEEHQYVLTRTYILNTLNVPVEAVKLNMNGVIFAYGTATPATQRAEQEAQVNKIIKANLPQELSRYFLFDAMEAGNLLKEDQLNRVIKENIENVMGFNKYMLLAKSSEAKFQAYTAQRLQVENERNEYLQLVDEKNKKQLDIDNVNNKLQIALQYSVANKDLYDNLKNGLNQESVIKNKLEQTKNQIENINKKEGIFINELDQFVKDVEFNVFLPKLAETLKSEISLILKSRSEHEHQQNGNFTTEQIETIGSKIIAYLKEHNLILTEGIITMSDLVDYVMSASKKSSETVDDYDFLEFSEIKALEDLLNVKAINSFPSLNQAQVELNLSLKQVPLLESQIENMRAQLSGRDYVLLKEYEANEDNIVKSNTQIAEIEAEIAKIDKRIHQFDVQINQEPDPRYETLGKLKGFFEDAANKLLKAKKQQIESKMKQDLNINLAAYKDVIDRVELSENLKDLTFKIYHTKGNELYLNQLNTASKQIVIQVLLKSLHEFGDYDPPVMIDTVMGVLSEKSRATVLENYFPELSHQTILLSSDSEIRTGIDLEKIEPFISKTYTLIRDREKQQTAVVSGYFGVSINE